MKLSVTHFVDLAFLAGMCAAIAAVLYGLGNLVSKVSGRGQRIKTGAVLWPMVCGACLATVLIAIQSVE